MNFQSLFMWRNITRWIMETWFCLFGLQTCFIISVCNNQLLDLVENELLRVLSLVPGVASILPKLIAKLHFVREKYMEASPRVPSNAKVYIWSHSHTSNCSWIICLFVYQRAHFIYIYIYLFCQVKGWDLSLGSVWNTVVLLILVNFMMKTINAIAQGFMKEQHEKEMMAHQDDTSAQWNGKFCYGFDP